MIVATWLPRPYIINAGERDRGDTQVLRHGLVSILTCADIHS